jgi:uncharacterized membrane protein
MGARNFSRTVFVSLLLLTPLLASADPRSGPDPGLSYHVVNVGIDDVLNVRRDPSKAAPNIGRLQPNATGVIVTGVRQTAEGAHWWEVVHTTAEEKVAWINAYFLAPAEGKSQSDFNLRCLGTEPFWNLDFSGAQAIFTTAQGEQLKWRGSHWRQAAGFQTGQRFAIDLGGADLSNEGWAAVSRAQEFCTDGMSDSEYPYDVIIAIPTGDIHAGCCARAP